MEVPPTGDEDQTKINAQAASALADPNVDPASTEDDEQIGVVDDDIYEDALGGSLLIEPSNRVSNTLFGLF